MSSETNEVDQIFCVGAWFLCQSGLELQGALLLSCEDSCGADVM